MELEVDNRDVIDQRLTTQGLLGPGLGSPDQAVEFLTAVQSQEFAAAKWALGERCRGTTDASIQRAFDEGQILRTHILRPTWHFVRPTDIRWMLRLTSPHLKRMNAGYLRKDGLDGELVRRCHQLITSALADRDFKTRREIHALLAANGIELSAFQLGFILIEAEFDSLICSGPMRGKQHTYALLDERVAGERDLRGEEALAELSRRYFISHGPSTDREFARWSGLNVTQARAGLAMVSSELASIDIDGIVHWFDPAAPSPGDDTARSFLLHEYDECYLSYLSVNFPDSSRLDDLTDLPTTFYRPVIINGSRVGYWRREIVRKSIEIELLLFAPLWHAQQRLLEQEVERFGEFHGMPASITATALLSA